VWVTCHVYFTLVLKNKSFFSETNLVSKACKGLDLFLNKEGLKSARFKASCPPQGVYSSFNSLVNRNEALVDEKIDRVHKLTLFVFRTTIRKKSKTSLSPCIFESLNWSQWETYHAHWKADEVYFSIHIFISYFGAGKGQESKGYKVRTKPMLLPPVCRNEREHFGWERGFGCTKSLYLGLWEHLDITI